MRTTHWGGLNVRIVEPAVTDSVTLNVILSHGYGAPGTDLVPLATMMQRFATPLQAQTRFIFPEAPLDLEDIGLPGGRAWWHLDMWKLQEAVSTGKYRDLTNETPEGLPAARQLLTSLLQTTVEETGIPVSRTVLGGFSQGAMLSTDVSLHLDESPAGLIILSGTMINQTVWLEQMKHRSGLPVLQSHGHYDPLLPLEIATRLRDALETSGNPVTFYEFPGGHEIPFEVMEFTAKFLGERL